MVNLMIERRLIAALIIVIFNAAIGIGYGADLRSLYVSCGNLLLRLPTTIAGKKTYRPDQ